MSLRDQLVENYEESLMALFMNKIADYEGELLQKENERLENDPNFEVPLQLDNRCLNAISRSRFRLRRKCAARPRGKRHMAARVILIAALASFSLLAGACCAFPAFGASVHNLLIRATDAATYFRFEDRDADRVAAAAPEFDYSIPELPSGFEVADYGETRLSQWIKYKKSNLQIIKITIYPGKETTLSANTEGGSCISQIDSNGFEGIVFQSIENDSVVISAIADVRNTNFITITFDGLPSDECLSFTNKFIQIN